jgi:hypothetical protein
LHTKKLKILLSPSFSSTRNNHLKSIYYTNAKN